MDRPAALNHRSVEGSLRGEIREYVEIMQHTRDEALYRRVEHAKAAGANGVISTYFDSSENSDCMHEIVAYGTAVVIRSKQTPFTLINYSKEAFQRRALSGPDGSFEAFIRFKETTAKTASRTNRMSRATRIATMVA